MDLATLKNKLRGPLLRKTLKQAGVSKYRLARDLGISQRTLYLWQKGTVEPSDEYAEKVLIYLGLLKPDAATKQKLQRELKELQKKVDRL